MQQPNEQGNGQNQKGSQQQSGNNEQQSQSQQSSSSGESSQEQDKQSQEQSCGGSVEDSQKEEKQQDVGHDTHSMWDKAIEKKHQEEQSQSNTGKALPNRLLPDNLYCLHFALPAGISVPARTWKISCHDGCSGLFYRNSFLPRLSSWPAPFWLLLF